MQHHTKSIVLTALFGVLALQRQHDAGLEGAERTLEARDEVCLLADDLVEALHQPLLMQRGLFEGLQAT